MKGAESRLCASGGAPEIATVQLFTEEYKTVIAEKDKSFYTDNLSFASNFRFVIDRYTGDAYRDLNEKLRKGGLQKKDKSFIFTLHSAAPKIKVAPGTVVYRGLRNVGQPKGWKDGAKFYLPEFVSTSRNEKVALGFAGAGGLLLH